MRIKFLSTDADDNNNDNNDDNAGAMTKDFRNIYVAVNSKGIKAADRKILITITHN